MILKLSKAKFAWLYLHINETNFLPIPQNFCEILKPSRFIKNFSNFDSWFKKILFKTSRKWFSNYLNTKICSYYQYRLFYSLIKFGERIVKLIWKLNGTTISKLWLLIIWCRNWNVIAFKLYLLLEYTNQLQVKKLISLYV